MDKLKNNKKRKKKQKKINIITYRDISMKIQRNIKFSLRN